MSFVNNTIGLTQGGGGQSKVILAQFSGADYVEIIQKGDTYDEYISA